MANVQLTGVGKVYSGDVRAVESVDLAIADGEFVVLVGPSGCGKSTTLRMIAGLETITEGTIAIDGRVVNDIAARDRDIAMVFQNYALYPHMTVEQNLSFGLERRAEFPSRLRSLCSSSYRSARRAEQAAIRSRVEAAAKTLGITDLLGRQPRALSGGQRQRVAVGRALVREPKAFLFDEPLSNLDAKLRVEMRSELRGLHRELGATMVYVTHDQEEAMTLGDRLVVMRDGIVQQVASPSEIYQSPANRFVAGFVGTPAMNFIEGNMDKGGCFTFDGGTLQLNGKVPSTGAIVVGIRPEALAKASDTAAMIQGKVESREFLGDRADIVVRVGAHRLVWRTAAAECVQEGEVVSLVVHDDGGLHMFAADDEGRALC